MQCEESAKSHKGSVSAGRRNPRRFTVSDDEKSFKMSLEMSQLRELAIGVREAAPDLASNRQEGLHRFR